MRLCMVFVPFRLVPLWVSHNFEVCVKIEVTVLIEGTTSNMDVIIIVVKYYHILILYTV